MPTGVKKIVPLPPDELIYRLERRPRPPSLLRADTPEVVGALPCAVEEASFQFIYRLERRPRPPSSLLRAANRELVGALPCAEEASFQIVFALETRGLCQNDSEPFCPHKRGAAPV